MEYIGVIFAEDLWESEQVIHQAFVFKASNPDDAFHQVQKALLLKVKAAHLGEDGYLPLNRVQVNLYSQSIADGAIDCTDSGLKPSSFRSSSCILSDAI